MRRATSIRPLIITEVSQQHTNRSRGSTVHQYPIIYTMLHWFQYPTMILITYLIYLVSQVCSDDTFSFLVEGEEVEFTQRTKTDRLTIIVSIDIDAVSGRFQFKAIDTLLLAWGNYPAFNQTPDIGFEYLGLVEKAVDDILRAAALLDRIVLFKDVSITREATYACTYTHDMILLEEMKTQVKNLQNNFAKLDTAWTAASIVADLNKDTALRQYATLLGETLENWLDSLNAMLGVLDTLASNKIPEEVQGHYQSAPCVGNYFEESITILDCYGTKVGYLCDVEITVPMSFKKLTHMIPVHYEGIRIRGDTLEQLFVKEIDSNIIQLMECNQYGFNTENIPNCELHTLDKDCRNALLAKDDEDTIHKCNFTQHDPPLAVRTFTGGLLVQGPDTVTSILNGTDYKVLTGITPVIIYSPSSISVKHGSEEMVFSAIDKQVSIQVVKSRLTQKLVDTLESKLYWQILQESTDIEDITRYIILILQIVLYPIALAGIGLGLRARRQLLSKVLRQGKSNKQIYKANSMAMKRLSR